MQKGVEKQEQFLYRALARAVLLATGVFLFIWFINEALLAILFVAVAFIFALALNPPIVWLEKRGIGRGWGTLLVIMALLGVVTGVGFAVAPRLVEQVSTLAADVPNYAELLNRRALRWLENYPAAQQFIQNIFSSDREIIQRFSPFAQSILARVGGYTLSAIGLVIFGLLLLTTVIYTLAQPKPLLQSYIHIFPANLRDKAERAYIKSADAVAGWLWSNVIVGAIEAALAAIVLSLLGVPGALVWAALTFFAELVPQLGPYLMMAPPVVVALAVDPLTALWVALFYIAMMQIVGNVIAPYVRSSQMKLHPVSLLFSVLAMGSVFGILGALIATPMTGIFKAFYDEFFAESRPDDPQREKRVARMLERQDLSRKNAPRTSITDTETT
jgi:putative permease